MGKMEPNRQVLTFSLMELIKCWLNFLLLSHALFGIGQSQGVGVVALTLQNGILLYKA